MSDSIKHIELKQAEFNLLGKLALADAQEARGERGISHTVMMELLREKIDQNWDEGRY